MRVRGHRVKSRKRTYIYREREIYLYLYLYIYRYRYIYKKHNGKHGEESMLCSDNLEKKTMESNYQFNNLNNQVSKTD